MDRQVITNKQYKDKYLDIYNLFIIDLNTIGTPPTYINDLFYL